MAIDDDDDLFNEEFDLVDDDDYESDDESADNESYEEDEVPEEEVAKDDADEKDAPKKSKKGARRKSSGRRTSRSANGKPEADEEGAGTDEESSESGEKVDDGLDEYGRPKPEPNYVVHIYEYDKFKRTLERPFTPEDAEAFATEYNRTGKIYRRFALAGKNDVKPKKTVNA